MRNQQGVQETTVCLPVMGMGCGSCVGKVELALGEVPGVRETAVDIQEARATVTGTAGVADLVAAIDGAGYEVPAIITGHQPANTWETSDIPTGQ